LEVDDQGIVMKLFGVPFWEVLMKDAEFVRALRDAMLRYGENPTKWANLKEHPHAQEES
jgi:hypothetical protein